MINWQSILSSFDDKPTLLEWLKKVQKALSESVLKTVSVSQEKTGKVNSITLSFDFEDGTKITAPAFTINDGKDTDFELLTAIQTVVGDFENITYDTTDGLTLVSQGELTYGGEKTATTFTTRIPIIGSANISVDLDEVNQKLVFSLDPHADAKFGENVIIQSPNDEYTYMKLHSDGNAEIIYHIPPGDMHYQFPIGLAPGYYNVVTSGNVKTIFGNKSIVGSGNIDLYQHRIAFDSAVNGVVTQIRLTVISSNNLKVDSLTDLKTLLGSTFEYSATGFQTNESVGDVYHIYAITNSSIRTQSGLSNTDISYPAGTWTDTVTTV